MNAARFTEELESISKNTRLFKGRMDETFALLGKRLADCMQVERVNLWLFNDTEERIECIGNYNRNTDTFTTGEQLRMRDMPKYYAHLKSNQTLVIDDVHNSEITAEIADQYCQQYGISSMLDLPIRIQGELRGVMCYEHAGEQRSWTDEEIHFALAANQVVALAMETSQRRTAQKKLEAALREKELLLKEMHHRIKNNLSVLMSLLRMQARESGDMHVQTVLSDCETRIFSMAKIHEHLYNSENYLKVDMSVYLKQLVEEFRISSEQFNERITFQCNIDKIMIETSRAINIGLIVMEILNNVTKHAFKNNSNDHNIVRIKFKKLNDHALLQIRDNGIGFDPQKTLNQSLGMTLIEDLSEQIDAEMKLNSSEEGTSYAFRFVLNDK